jgi:hypothetical protein
MSAVQVNLAPRNVILFSGHIIDAPDRKTPRFPPGKECAAADAIANTLAEIGVDRGDFAICGGASGGDLLFAEACLAQDMWLELYLPFDEPTFLSHSVDFRHGDWHNRYLAARSKATLHPDELGPARMLTSATIYGCCNRQLGLATRRLPSSLFGTARAATVRAAQPLDEARSKTSRIYWLDTESCGTEGSTTCPCAS